MSMTLEGRVMVHQSRVDQFELGQPVHHERGGRSDAVEGDDHTREKIVRRYATIS